MSSSPPAPRDPGATREETLARRMRLLRAVALAAGHSGRRDAVLSRALRALDEAIDDVPFALVYTVDEDGRFHLCASVGVRAGATASPERIEPAQGGASPWPVDEVFRTKELRLFDDLDARVSALSLESDRAAPRAAALVPVSGAGVLVMGVDPRWPFDGDYRCFAELLADVLAGALVGDRVDECREEALREVSHGLRTSLGVIRTQAWLVRRAAPEGEEGDDLRRWADVSARTVESMNRYLQDLLDVSRFESSRVTLDLADVDVGPLVRDALEMNEPLAAEREVRLEGRVAQGAVAHCDRKRVVYALARLVGHVLASTPAGGAVEVTVTTEPELTFVVRDTGPGIAPEELSGLFEPHWQTRSARRGAGLDLALVRCVVGAHGGGLRVETAAGHGAGVAFTLPRRRT